MVSFAELTTLGVGGPIERYVRGSAAELIEAARSLAGEPRLVLGGGSNLLVSDEGFEGTVLSPAAAGIEIIAAVGGVGGPVGGGDVAGFGGVAGFGAAAGGSGGAGEVLLRAEAGAVWDDLVQFALGSGLPQLAPLSGIPGSVGGAVVQNIGAYGTSLDEFVHSVEAYDFYEDAQVTLPASALQYGYRTSALKGSRRWLVLAALLRLSPAGAVPVAYEQLANSLEVPLGSLLEGEVIRAEVLRMRAAKGMLTPALMPAGFPLANTASAGSFFTNPTVSRAELSQLPTGLPRWPLSRVDQTSCPAVPRDLSGQNTLVVSLEDMAAGRVDQSILNQPLEQSTESFRVSAAWLIEHSGFTRGFSLPGSRAAISSQHALALTNQGGAAAAQIIELARLIHYRVQSNFGIALQPEPVLVGLEL